MQRLVDGQVESLKDIEQGIERLEAEIAAVQKQQAQAVKLRKVRGLGLLGATELAATVEERNIWEWMKTGGFCVTERIAFRVI